MFNNYRANVHYKNFEESHLGISGITVLLINNTEIGLSISSLYARPMYANSKFFVFFISGDFYESIQTVAPKWQNRCQRITKPEKGQQLILVWLH